MNDVYMIEDDTEPLNVPLPNADDLDAIEASLRDDEPSYVQSTITHAPQSGTPGERVECNTCGKTVLVRKDGLLATHKCEPKSARGNRLETLPEGRSPIRPRTREFTVGILAWCVEESSALLLSRSFGTNAEDVPTELPDADAQLGLPLDLMWPEIPEGARKFLDKMADNPDVLECGVAWFEWGRNISRWARQRRHVQQQIMQSRNPASNMGGQVMPFQAVQD